MVEVMKMKEGYRQTEIGIIPSDWEVDEIQNLMNITTGAKNTQDKIQDGDYPFFVRSQTIERINSYSFDGEAVLTAGDGVKTGKVFHYINGKFDFHQRVYKISAFSERLSGYFFYLYFSKNFYNRIMQMTAKSSVDSVRREMIAKMLIPIPTKDEQTVIATALNDTHALITHLEKLIAKKRSIKQGAIQELLKPKEGWVVKKLGEVSVKVSNGYVYKPNKSIGVAITRIETISKGIIDFNRVGYAKKESNLEQYKLEKGDILFSHINSIDHIGKVAYYNDERELYHGMNLLAIRANKQKIDDNFLFIWLGSEFGRLKSKVLAKQAINQASISTTDLKDMEIPIPTFKIQTHIAQTISDMDAEIEALERKLEKYKMITQGMMQNLLTGKIRLV